MKAKAALGAILALTVATPAMTQTVVPLPEFRAIELRGGGKVTLRYAPRQRVTLLNGSTQYTEFVVGSRGSNNEKSLRIDACNSRCPQRYNLEILIETPNVQALAVRGGGEIEVASGFPSQNALAASVSGGGEIDARSLPVRNAAASVNGGGSLLVRPANSLAAAVRGGGAIRYWGNPSVSTSISGGGAVVKQ